MSHHLKLVDNATQTSPTIIAIASGKGGVGKTNLALNLALGLSDGLRQVCLLDADLGLANVDVLLGLSTEYSLVDCLEGRRTLDEVMVSGPRALKIIPGGSAMERLPHLGKEERRRLHDLIGRLGGLDVLVVDCAAGLSEEVLHFLKSATIPLLVITPEPTSLTDAYALLKLLKRRKQETPVHVLVNQVRSVAQAQLVFKRFREAVDRYLDLPLRPMGYVLIDPKIPEAVSNQTAFLEMFPNAPASRCLERIVAHLDLDAHRPTTKGELEALFFAEEEAGEPIPEETSPPPARRPVEPIPEETTPTPVRRPVEPPLPAPAAAERPEDILRLLVREGVVTSEQVERARRVQQRLKQPRRLLTVLKALKYVTDDQIREALRQRRGSVRLGSLLVELGHVTEKQLNEALNRQKKDGDQRPVGDLLIEAGAISAYTLPQVLAVHLGYPYVEPDPARLDVALLERGSRDLFLGHGFLPLGRTASDAVRVAMADPLSEEDLVAAREVYGPDLDPAITMRRLIREALDGFESVKKSEPPARLDPEEMVGVVERLVQEAVRRRATHIHLEPLRQRLRVRFRQNGSLVHHEDLPKDREAALLSRLKTMASLDPAVKTGFQDGRIRMTSSQLGGEVQAEVSFLATPLGERATLKLGSGEFVWRKSDGLGMASKTRERFLEEVLDAPAGLVLIAGPAGSGRTTTLYAAIHHARAVESQIVTAEHPVAQVIEGVTQAVVPPENGPGHEAMVAHLLKQDPDILVLGALAAPDLAQSAARAAMDGLRVWTTLTAEDSVSALFELRALGIDAHLTASAVAGALSQRLVRTLCPHCREDYTPTARDLRHLKLDADALKDIGFSTARGCQRCDFTGYQGRTGVFELLVMTEAVQEAVAGGGSPAAVRRAALRSAGWVSLAEDGLTKAAAGLTSLPEICRKLPVSLPPRSLDKILSLTGSP